MDDERLDGAFLIADQEAKLAEAEGITVEELRQRQAEELGLTYDEFVRQYVLGEEE